MVRLIFILLLPAVCFAADHPESWYIENWCLAHGGEIEITLEDRTRCDCITKTHAIEFDFAKKYYQAIGQSLHYGRMSDKKPGIVLILEKDSDLRYWHRLLFDVEFWLLPVDVWPCGPAAEKIKKP